MNLEMLSSPIQIGKGTASNRIVNQPMECNEGNTADACLPVGRGVFYVNC
jgi:2,4-dienoyl-CoA reductase-like NADH-dependent reductase (Old Yellow Enzyme family)